MKPFYLRSKVGGIIFTDPSKVPEGYTGFFSVEAWVDAKAPSNSLIYDDPTMLTTVGLPIVDGFLVDGIWHRHRRGRIITLDEVKVTFKRFTYYKVVTTSAIEGSETKPPKRHDSLIAFNLENVKCQPKQAGTLVKAW